jgi:hypothetical protein
LTRVSAAAEVGLRSCPGLLGAVRLLNSPSKDLLRCRRVRPGSNHEAEVVRGSTCRPSTSCPAGSPSCVRFLVAFLARKSVQACCRVRQGFSHKLRAGVHRPVTLANPRACCSTAAALLVVLAAGRPRTRSRRVAYKLPTLSLQALASSPPTATSPARRAASRASRCTTLLPRLLALELVRSDRVP